MIGDIVTFFNYRRDGLHINAAMTYFVNALFVLRYWYDH